jgi:glycerophosphoryl diester phosphodiesterase
MIIYGHRGAKGEAPENTLAGFQHAYRHGIRHFEMDIQLSADGLPVVIHDLTVDRTANAKGPVSTFTADQLADLDARRNTPAWPTPIGIPSLEAIFQACPDFTHMQLEVKKDARSRLNALCNRLVETIHRHHWQRRLTITSSDIWFLQAVKRRDRDISIGLVTDRRFPNPTKTAINLGCNYLCLKWTLCSAKLVEIAHRNDLHVSVWTVNRIHDMLALEEKGVDSIITDYPTSTRVYFDNRLTVGDTSLPRPDAARLVEEGDRQTTDG